VRAWLLVLACLCHGGGAAGQQVVLVEDGKVTGCILVEADAPSASQHAARELQLYLERISGAKLPIVAEPAQPTTPVRVALGRTSFAQKQGVTDAGLPPDGFRLRAAGGALVVVGRDHRGPVLGGRRGRTRRTYCRKLGLNAYGETGTLFGVYHFLRAQGCRWFLPGEIGEVVPTRKTVAFDGKPVDDAPHSIYRMFYGFDFNTDLEAALWYKRVGFGGVRYVNLNHSFTHWCGAYAKEHPEYFALIDGKRHCETVKDKARVLLCYANEGTLRTKVREASDYFAKNPNEPLFAVVPND